MIAKPLIQHILAQYTLPYHGLHGVSHWARVLDNGRRLATLTGANLAVVELFAVFHDSRRLNEGTDHDHGRRGADLAASLRGSLVTLDDAEFEQLYEACRYHTDRLCDDDVTIQACWDADRLDLPRAQIHPDPRKLCTQAARDPSLRAWAEQRSVERLMPAWVEQEWGIEIQR